MVLKVHMTAFGREGEVREVTIPRDSHPSIDQLLDDAFHWGQNDFQPQQHPSVSVGDVIQVGEELFLVQPAGFRPMTQEEFNRYLQTPRRDRTLVGF